MSSFSIRKIGCLGVFWLLFFKVFFLFKIALRLYFFYFLKIIFNISTSKQFKNIKNIFKNHGTWIARQTQTTSK
jgi:hypothetical protein